MEINDIMMIVGACIISAGGIGSIIIAVVKFCSDLIADRLSEKYEAKLQKEMEKYKTELSKKEYVSKTKFDAEFTIYRELSKAFFNVVKEIIAMIPYSLDNRHKEDILNSYKGAKKAAIVAQDVLNGNAPFIQKTMFEKFNEILSLCKKQLKAFESQLGNLCFEEVKNPFTKEEYNRSKEISDKFNVLCSDMRAYLSSLDVVE